MTGSKKPPHHPPPAFQLEVSGQKEGLLQGSTSQDGLVRKEGPPVPSGNVRSPRQRIGREGPGSYCLLMLMGNCFGVTFLGLKNSADDLRNSQNSISSNDTTCFIERFS